MLIELREKSHYDVEHVHTHTHTHIIRSLWYILEEKNVFKLFHFCFLFPKVRVSVSESCRAATAGDFGEYASNYF